MKRLLKKNFYILIATALVTISPFLITFNKDQCAVHGLFEFGEFAILLYYVFLKKYISFRRKKIFVIVTYTFLVAVSLIDLQTILGVKKSSIGAYGIIPFITCFLALAILKNIKGISFKQINAILFISFFAHFGAIRFYPEQPLLQFSIPLYLAQHEKGIDRSYLPEEFRTRYNATDSLTITKHFIDTSRSNVIILVESWGIPMDTTKFNTELAVFESSLKKQGVHFRMYSRTRTAEREDLLDSIRRDSIGYCDSLFTSKRFAELGYTTTFLFGGDSTIQWRYKYIRNIGFQNAIWTDSATADIVMAAKLDSLLSLADSTKHFIAWTTRDTRFPISDNPVETEKLYYERLFGTLKIVADLAKKHPEVRFIAQGDHEPILSPLEFQAKFYRRWVPYVVLN